MDQADVAPPAGTQDFSFLPDQNPAAPGPTPASNPDTPLDLPDQISKTEQTYNQVSDSDPDKAAAVTKIAKQTGAPEGFISNNLPALQKAQAAPPSSFFSQLEDQYPGTTKHLEDPRVMAATHDDLPNMAQHEGLIQKFKDAGQFIKNAGEQGSLQEELNFLRAGQVEGNDNSVPNDLFRLGGSIANAEGFSQTSAKDRIDQINSRLSEISASQSQYGGIKKGLSGAIGFLPMIAGGLTYGASGAVAAGGIAAAGTAYLGPGAAVPATVAAGYGFTAREIEYNFKYMMGGSYDSLLKVRDVNGNPLPDNVAKIASVGMGAATAGLSFVKLGAVLDTIPGGKEFLAKFTSEAGEKVLANQATYQSALKSFATTWATATAHGVAAMEGITAVNIAGTEAAKAAATGQTFEHPSMGQIASELGETAKSSALTFGFLGLPGTAVGLSQGLMEAKKTEAAKDFYTSMGDTAEASKLRSRLPEEHKAFVDTLTKDSPVENLYASPQALEQYFQSKKIDTPTVMQELGVTKSYEEAKATGEKVKIPLSTWTDKVVGTEHYNGLANDISFNPDDLSVNEYAQKREEIRSGAEKAAAQAQAPKEGEVPQEGQPEAPAQNPAVESGQRVYQEVSNLLKATGLSQKEVTQNPKLQEAFFRTLGQNLGQDPYELFKQFPLSVNGVQAGFEGGELPELKSLTAAHIATPEDAIKNIGTKERGDQLEAQLHEKAVSAQERIDAAGGRSKAAPEDIQALKESGDALNNVRAVKDRLPQEKEFNQQNIKELPKTVTWEAIPSTALNAEINSASPEAKEAFTREALKIITDVNGKDELASKLGLDKNESTKGTGAYAGAINPNVISGFDTTDPSKINDYARAIQYIYKQDAVPFFEAKFAKESSGSHAVLFRFSEAPNEPNFFDKLRLVLGPDAGYTKINDHEIAVIDFEGRGQAFSDAIARLVDTHGKELGIGKTENFRADGEYGPVHDWGKDPSGMAILDSTRAEGSPDLQSWIHSRRELFEGLLKDWSGEKLKEFSQSDDETKRGTVQVQGNNFNIKFLEHADKSTFLHETGHTFLEVMGKTADKLSGMDNLSDTQTRVLNDSKTLLNWLGVDSWDKVGKDEHEKFAEGFEKYLAEGKAPTPELQSAFSAFKKWLVSIYRNIANIYPKVELTPEVKAVMDRMLATDDEINRAQAETGYKDEVTSKVPAQDAKSIQDMQSKARATAEEALLKQQMPETTKEHAKYIEDTKARLTKLAKVDVEQEPVFAAAKDLKEKIGEPYDSAQKFLDGRLRKENIARFEATAEEHGFTDGKDLANQLADARKTGLYNNSIQERVDQGMKSVADLKDTDAIRAKALEAIHNENSAELLALESHALSKMVLNTPEAKAEISNRKRIEARVEAQLAKESARDILADKPIKESTKSSIYVTAERKAAVRVSKALADGDMEAATKAKREQLLNHSLAAEAMRNETEVNRKLDYLKQFKDRGRNLESMPYGFVRQIDDILSKFGLKEKSNEDLVTQNAMAQDLLAKGSSPDEIANATGLVIDPTSEKLVPEKLPDMIDRVNDNYYAISIPDSVALDDSQRSPEDLKLGDLRELYDGVKTLATAGQKYEKFLGAFDKADIKEAASDFRAETAENVGTPYAENKKIGSKFDSALKEKLDAITSLPDAVIGSQVNLLTICDFLDGRDPNGKAKEYIYRPLKHAEDAKLERYGRMTEEVKAILEKHYPERELVDYKKERIRIPEMDNRVMTKDEILSMALNWGNEGNKDRIMKGFGIDEAQAQAAFKHLGKNDWDFAQATWNHLNSYWPEIRGLEERVNGVTPQAVEASPFENEHGKYEGGYYPIAYDFEKSSDAYKNAQDKNALYKQYSTSKAQTEQGHTEMRVQNVTRAVRLNTDVLFNHLDNVVHDLSFREPVIDVSRFLAQKDTKGAIEDAIGIKGYSAVGDHLKAVAADQGQMSSPMENALKWFRFGTSMATMGWKVASAFPFATGNVINAVWEVGLSKFGSMMTEFVKDPKDIINFVEEKSERMAHRSTMRDRDILDLSKDWQGKKSAISTYAFLFHQYADQAVSIPMWHSVYQANLSEFGEKKAIDLADEAVTKTFAGGSPLDQVGAQRGGEFKKIFSTFFSFKSMMFNRFWADGKFAGLEYSEGNVGKAIAIVAKATFLGVGMQAAQENFWKEALRNKKKDDEDAMKKRILTRTLTQPFSSIWIAGDIANFAAERAVGQPGAHVELSPTESAIESVIAPFGDAANIAFNSRKHFDQKFSEDVARGAAVAFKYPQQINTWAFNFLDNLNHNGQLTWRDLLNRKTKN